jgi:NADH-quinone oxidoreductase subunit C
MTSEELKNGIVELFKEDAVVVLQKHGLSINVKSQQVISVLRFLQDSGYDHLTMLSCVDWPEEKEFELVYILSFYSDAENKDRHAHIIVKTRIPREKGEFKTIIPLFENAEPYEREIHELFGIRFEGHPRLTPLFLEREYKIPPFRKDFDTRGYVKEFFDSIPAIEDLTKKTKK